MQTKIILLAAAVALAASPAMAFYTECTASKEADLLNRPDGHTDPRFLPVEKGDKVAFRDEYQGWWFVLHGENYGWIPKNVLVKCKKMDGTP